MIETNPFLIVSILRQVPISISRNQNYTAVQFLEFRKPICFSAILAISFPQSFKLNFHSFLVLFVSFHSSISFLFTSLVSFFSNSLLSFFLYFFISPFPSLVFSSILLSPFCLLPFVCFSSLYFSSLLCPFIFVTFVICNLFSEHVYLQCNFSYLTQSQRSYVLSMSEHFQFSHFSTTIFFISFALFSLLVVPPNQSNQNCYRIRSFYRIYLPLSFFFVSFFFDNLFLSIT